MTCDLTCMLIGPLARALRMLSFCLLSLLPRKVGVLLAVSAGLSVCGHAADWTQTIQLDYGWNSLWLEVSPRGADGKALTAEELFVSTDFTVDKVARLGGSVGFSEFVDDPGASFDPTGGWVIWARNSVSGENPVVRMRAHQAYMVHVMPSSGTAVDGSPAGSMLVTGRVEFSVPEIRRGSYNMLGFGVTGAPSFESLLAGSGMAIVPTGDTPSVLRLDSTTGGWIPVNATDPVESGRAYWFLIPSRLDGSLELGPVASSFSGRALGTLDLGSGVSNLKLITVPGIDPAEALEAQTVELSFSNLQPAGGPGSTLRIDLLSPSVGDPDYSDLEIFPIAPSLDSLHWEVVEQGVAGILSESTVTARGSKTLTFGVKRNWTSGARDRERLYRIEAQLDGGGIYQYLPVRASNPDLFGDGAGEATDGTASVGLWAGNVVLEEVTTLADSGLPVEEATSEAKLRILLHVDASGQASLLSRVMLMSEKVADESLVPQQVLVVNEDLIPYFEGVQERGGKSVGLRLETVAFAMPRDLRAASQSQSLLTAIGATIGKTAAEVTDADVESYFDLSNRQDRPPDLPETYYYTWPLQGALEEGQSLVSANPLTMDAFHQKNPYRHAYHPQLGAGYAVSRSIQIHFEERPRPGVCVGEYQETVSGLTKFDLVTRGRIVLNRVNQISSLQQ